LYTNLTYILWYNVGLIQQCVKDEDNSNVYEFQKLVKCSKRLAPGWDRLRLILSVKQQLQRKLTSCDVLKYGWLIHHRDNVSTTSSSCQKLADRHILHIKNL
jgi:hypothetical protein